MGTYHPESMIATEFIDDAEIQETLEFAKEHANDVEMAREILNKGAKCKGLSYREAAVLLECEDETIKQETFRLAREIKEKFYGNRIVLFAPLLPVSWAEQAHCP